MAPPWTVQSEEETCCLALQVGYRTRSTLLSWLPSGRVRPGCQLVMGMLTMVNGCHENQRRNTILPAFITNIWILRHGESVLTIIVYNGWVTRNSGKNGDFPHRSLCALTVKGYIPSWFIAVQNDWPVTKGYIQLGHEWFTSNLGTLSCATTTCTGSPSCHRWPIRPCSRWCHHPGVGYGLDYLQSRNLSAPIRSPGRPSVLDLGTDMDTPSWDHGHLRVAISRHEQKNYISFAPSE